MNRLPLSHSGLELFDACPLRFKTERVDKIKAQPSIPMALGLFVHEVTDQYFKHLVKTGQRSDFAMMESLAKLAWANRKASPEWAGLPESLFEDMMSLIYAIREECVIDPGQIVSSEQEVAFNERWEQVKWNAKDAFFRAKIDRLELTQELTAIVWDLKTGRKIAKDANTPQMRRYAFVVTKLLPEAIKIQAQLCFPRKRVTYPADFVPADVAGVQDEIMRASDQIEAMREKGHWPATPKYMTCKDCPVRRECPAQRALAFKPSEPQTQDEAERLVKKWAMLDIEREEVKNLLQDYVNLNGPVAAAGMAADFVVSHRVTFDTEELHRALVKAGLNPLRFLKADTKLLAREIRKNEALGPKIDQIAKDKPTTSFKLTKAGDDDEDDA